MRAARFRERALAYIVDVAVVGGIGWALGLPVGIWALILIAYTALSLWAFAGRTPGKVLLRLQVVGRRHDALSPWQYVLRPLLSIVELALLCGGFVFALFSRERLAVHDLILGTRVVKSSVPRRRPAAARGRARAKGRQRRR